MSFRGLISFSLLYLFKNAGDHPPFLLIHSSAVLKLEELGEEIDFGFFFSGRIPSRLFRAPRPPIVVIQKHDIRINRAQAPYGIVNVSAKDLGTGKEQNITITASTNMSKDDIDKAVKEAEQFAADDKKKREEVDIRNGADQMVFQTEKMLKENGDKMSADVKSEAEAKLADLKTAVQSGSIDDIKAKQDALSHVFEKMYQAAAAAQQQAAGAQPGPDAGANNQQKPGDDGVVDADFKEV